ncbi:TonB-dependent receptor domain-containing protein [Inhella sp.]|uniref:TonB-dependent receptor domain-containing protein n=1 Tax=Inhella sp. TaxID=1921806 RepID=UPI0035AEFA12
MTRSRRPATPLQPLALATLLMLGAAAGAQTAAADEPKSEEKGASLKLDAVVVTGTTGSRSKMLQSVSVSSVNSESIAKSGAASAAEVLRSVPGLRAESSGGEGNANMTVRGAPISAGGSRYLQLQEDGLPVLLIGDVSFATADQFVRADGMVDSIQVVRGGSAGTTATNSPAGIVNFISKTGRQAGGSVALSAGLDHEQARLDFDAGGKISDSLRYQIAGFYRLGEGPRHTNVSTEDGGQLRMNLTHSFKGGYLRFHFKALDDQTPTYLPVPVRLNGNRIEQLPGIDPRTAFFINSNLAQDIVRDRNGNAVTTQPGDGLQIKSSAFGVELQADVGDGFSINSKFRAANNSGRFIGAFPAGSAPTAAANGANRYTGATQVFSMHLFNTSLDDMGNAFSDTRLAKAWDLGGGQKLTGTAGLFWGKQAVAQTWYWNRYNVELKGDGARILDNAGNPSTVPVGHATTTWGGCCVRAIDVDLTSVAPYLALTYDAGPLSIDGSLRRDRQRAAGWQMFDKAPAADGSFTGWDLAGRNNVAYKASNSSYSLGANYRLSGDMAAFARISKGNSYASPDRIIWDGDVAAGRNPYPVNELKQFEAGLKVRDGGFNGFFTFFDAKTNEDGGFEVTTRSYLKDKYHARGIEAEVSYAMGSFSLTAGATWTNAKIKSGANNGKTPRRQADFVYQLTPSYALGDDLEFGASIVGTTKSYAQNDNQVVLPAYFVVNPYLTYNVSAKLQLQLSVNNAFNKLAYTEAEGQGNLEANPLYVARALNGRAAKATLRYSF